MPNVAGTADGSAHTGGAGAATGLLDVFVDVWDGCAACWPQPATSIDAAASTAMVRENAIGPCFHGGRFVPGSRGHQRYVADQGVGVLETPIDWQGGASN
ncbi:hypothetical protein MTY59_11680 [Mycobacterium senriense]|uniref:Uncharacterized protein n=1 Tax=Mycobacterium senriense TaxID=2775496 RepID=A0ABM7SJM7_9MYCO|nr:hypothetical protein MTY59_11680 [Mycobacterium senriense]